MTNVSAWNWFLAGVLAQSVSNALILVSHWRRPLLVLFVVMMLFVLALGKWRFHIGAVAMIGLSGMGAVSTALPPYDSFELVRVAVILFDAVCVACGILGLQRFGYFPARRSGA
ncbi:MAG TPA: hypothetical protein VK988_03595 [Acidimicrobiales bacterium]|nr:hypothetical protein [Acidimicrobiales bacterium]